MAFKDGTLVFAQPGALPPAALEQVIAAVRALDMDEVRATPATGAEGRGALMSQRYTLGATVPVRYDETVAAVREALAETRASACSPRSTSRRR